jgi:hypothetical protein
VEFSIVLPLFLFLVLGIVELGRFVLIYASVAAASREGARYASAAGEAESGLPYYLDTMGIEAATKRITVLTGTSSVNITYDKGPGTADIELSSPPKASDLGLGDRVKIRAEAQYAPIFGLTAFKPILVRSITSRTILKNVSIHENYMPVLGVQITEPVSNTLNLGDNIHFVAVPINYIGSLTWQWASSIDGIISNSDQFYKNNLSIGIHTISVNLADESGVSASDAITLEIIGNLPPAVFITAPSYGSLFEEGQTIHFTGSALDPEDGDISATLIWTSNDGGTGGPSDHYDHAFSSQGNYTIVASVTDSGGLTASDSILVHIGPKLPPVVTITSPANGSTFPANSNISFSGKAIDAKDGNLSNILVWTLGDGTVMNNIASFYHAYSTPGDFTITASATDSDGLVGSKSITIHIAPGSPPVVTIDASSTTCVNDQSITLTGYASDAEDLDLSGDDLDWYDSGTWIRHGASFTYNCHYPPKYHTIQARVTDSDNLMGSASVTITVMPNTKPVVTIEAPANNSYYPIGQTIVFTGTATDAQDGDLSPYISWYSNLEGTNPIGTGKSISVNNLRIGTHVITARVTDSGGLTGSAVINITIHLDFCAALNGNSPVDLVHNKGYLTWDLINSSTVAGNFSFKLIGVNIPWELSPAGQRLSSITFGGYTLQTNLLPDGEPPTIINEGDWLTLAPNVFPAPPGGGSLTKQLVVTFVKNLEGTISSGARISVIFKPDIMPTITCTLTYQFP